MQTGYCQNRDFGIWYGFNAEHSISKKIEIDLAAVLRTFNNATRTDQAFFEGGITYKLNKHLSASGSYRFTEKIESNSRFYPRHKLFADIKATLPSGNFIFSSRFRFQYQNKTFIEKASDEIPDYHFRIKLKAVYIITQFPLNPYLYFESFSQLFANAHRFSDKNRFAAGVECKITQKQSVDAGYMLQRDFEPHISDMYIVSINYNIKF